MSAPARVASKVLSQKAFERFRSNRRWLQNALSDFSIACPESNTLTPRVLLYGSAISGTAMETGDADFAIVFSNSTSQEPTSGYSPIARDRQEPVLADLFKHIRDKTQSVGLKPQRIFHARIPILQYQKKMVDGGIMDFDVSLSIDGVKNSLLLRKYMQLDPRVHLGVMSVKQWGRDAKILNARRGWISPYALTIMYLYFMLSTGRAPAFIDETGIEEEVNTMMCASIDSIDSVEEFPDLNQALPLADTDVAVVQNDVHDFFSYYGNPSTFDFDVSVVDIRKNDNISEKDVWLARLEELAQVDRWHLLGHENIMVRDPYEPHSLGRSVDFFRGEAIREAFRVAGVERDPLTFLSGL